MDEFMFEAFGCWVHKRDGRIYVRYDSGGMASRMLESEITIEEVEKIKLSERDAYTVLIVAQARGNNKIQ